MRFQALFYSFLLLSSLAAGASTDITDRIFPNDVTVNDSIQAGAVKNANISVSDYASTSWAGVYGDVASRYVVGQNEQPFFSWELMDARYIYASSAEIDFSSNWSAANHSDLVNQYTFLANSTESPEETFNHTADVNSSFQEQAVKDSIAALTYNSTNQAYWPTVYLSDGVNGFFAGEIREGLSFNGVDSDFQLILPEDGSESGGTAYNIYLEME